MSGPLSGFTILEVAGIGPTLAQTVHAALAPAEATDTVEP